MNAAARDVFFFTLFGIAAIGAGIAAGGPPLPIIGVIALILAVSLLAETRGWLLGDPAETRQSKLSGCVVIVVLTVLNAVYVRLAGGNESPLRVILYLPIILSVLCFGVGFGLALGIALAAAILGGALQGSAVTHMPLRHVFLVAMTFPLMAGFAALLARRLEFRYRALHSRTDKLSTLADMSQMINSAHDLTMTMDLILLNVQNMSGCQACAVYLKDESGMTLERRSESVSLGHPSLLKALPLEEARYGDWSVTGEWRAGDLAVPFYLSDISPNAAPSALSLLAVDPHARAAACFPLASLEGMLGMVYVGFDHPDALTKDQIDGLELIITRAASPLQRLLQQRDFESLANTDVLTGLDNRRRFQQTLTEETARADRYKRALSLLILDIDLFKNVNDTFGHPAGDALLAQLAVILGNALRTVDRPARYGGEEFVVLCPETGMDEARLIAERIRRTVEETAFALPDVEKPVRVTVSVGVATYPDGVPTGPELVRQADAALYAAKAGGRNVVQGPEMTKKINVEKNDEAKPGSSKPDGKTARPRKLSKRLTRAR